MGFLPALAPYLTVLLLVLSNVFMTFAWYGHLKYPNAPMLVAIFGAWMVALIEYCLSVPANRIGHSFYSTAELKTIQEVITLIVFAGFSVFFLGEKLTIDQLCLVVGSCSCNPIPLCLFVPQQSLDPFIVLKGEEVGQIGLYEPSLDELQNQVVDAIPYAHDEVISPTFR